MLSQVKTVETHGYNAVQVGYQVVPERKITKPELNHLKKSGCPPMRKLKEYRVRTNLLLVSCTNRASYCCGNVNPIAVRGC